MEEKHHVDVATDAISIPIADMSQAPRQRCPAAQCPPPPPPPPLPPPCSPPPPPPFSLGFELRSVKDPPPFCLDFKLRSVEGAPPCPPPPPPPSLPPSCYDSETSVEGDSQTPKPPPSLPPCKPPPCPPPPPPPPCPPPFCYEPPPAPPPCQPPCPPPFCYEPPPPPPPCSPPFCYDFEASVEGDSPKMQKVPPKLIQENKQQDYEPLVVSFGPYHHGKLELQLAEEFKPKAMKMLVADSCKDYHVFYNVVYKKIEDVRSCYIDGSTSQYDDPTFVQMMLHDASFIIHYIQLSQFIPKGHKMLNYLGKWGFGQVIRDMLLLENQIPFFILKLLTCLAYGNDKGKKILNQFLNRNTFLSHKDSGIASSESEHPHPLHLLAAYRLTLLSEEAKVVKESSPPKYALRECLPKFWCSTRRKQKRDDDNEEHGNYVERLFVQSFRSVTDLKAKGIHFRSSSVDSLTNFEFKSGYISAKLKVPVTIVSVYTKVTFLNMIAYEMSAKTEIGIEVTNYIDFMKTLIDNPKDVKELREKKVLCSYVSSDEDVVKVFKEIGPYGLYYSKRFKDVKKEIEEHCNSKVKTWLAELIHTYFRSPWTAIALFAAIVLLVLTFLQTLYSIKHS